VAICLNYLLDLGGPDQSHFPSLSPLSKVKGSMVASTRRRCTLFLPLAVLPLHSSSLAWTCYTPPCTHGNIFASSTYLEPLAKEYCYYNSDIYTARTTGSPILKDAYRQDTSVSGDDRKKGPRFVLTLWMLPMLVKPWWYARNGTNLEDVGVQQFIEYVGIFIQTLDESFPFVGAMEWLTYRS